MLNKLFTALAGLLLFGGSIASAQEYVTNGSFEEGFDGTVHTGNGWAVYEEVDPWVTILGPGIEIQEDGRVVPAQDGNYYVELDSHTTTDTNSAMSQTMDFMEAGVYELSFWYRPRTNNGGDDNGIYASVYATGDEGNLLAFYDDSNYLRSSDDPDGGAWVEHTLRFVIESDGLYDLEFGAFGRDNSLGGFLDNVSVSAVPEPATWLMMIVGFAIVAQASRRRRKAAAALA